MFHFEIVVAGATQVYLKGLKITPVLCVFVESTWKHVMAGSRLNFLTFRAKYAVRAAHGEIYFMDGGSLILILFYHAATRPTVRLH